METLLGSPSPTPTAPEPVIAEKRKKPGLAFVLSLLLPGLGHIYCGKVRNGLVTLGFFATTICGVVFLNPDSLFWGIAIRAAIVLYLFGFLDAFYGAREINAGLDPYIVGNNPRIAATLNLLTNGFGYFYLGERKKGLILFFVLRGLSSVFTRGTSGFEAGTASQVSRAGSAFLEVVFIFIAIDAYRLARKQLFQSFPAETLDVFARPAGGLNPALPIAVGCLLSLNYFALTVIGLSMPSYDKVDRSLAKIVENQQEKVYTDPAYRLQMTVPATWDFNKDDKTFSVKAETLGGGCSVGVTVDGNVPWRGLRGDAHVLASSILAGNRDFRLQSEKPTQLGSEPAYEVSFVTNVNDVEVQQRYVLVQKRLTLYAFVATTASVLMDQCAPDIQVIQQKIAVGK